MSEAQLNWHVFLEHDDLIEVMADRIMRDAERAITAAGRFVVVLAGGSTPRPVYTRLAELDARWSHWHIYFGDERCLTVSHPERNDTMIREVLLDNVRVPADQVHPIPAELGPDAGAENYSRVLAGLGAFDLTILGLGEDGHTASLFPGGPLGRETDAPDTLAIHAAPKPPASRVSMSAQRLIRSHTTHLIATGEEKREALTRLRDDADMPIRSVIPANGVNLFVDRSASPSLVV